MGARGESGARDYVRWGWCNHRESGARGVGRAVGTATIAASAAGAIPLWTDTWCLPFSVQCNAMQAEAHAHDAYDFSDEEGVPPFREQLSAAAKRSHAALAADGKQPAAKRGKARR